MARSARTRSAPTIHAPDFIKQEIEIRKRGPTVLSPAQSAFAVDKQSGMERAFLEIIEGVKAFRVGEIHVRKQPKRQAAGLERSGVVLWRIAADGEHRRVQMCKLPVALADGYELLHAMRALFSEVKQE